MAKSKAFDVFHGLKPYSQRYNQTTNRLYESDNEVRNNLLSPQKDMEGGCEANELLFIGPDYTLILKTPPDCLSPQVVKQ